MIYIYIYINYLLINLEIVCILQETLNTHAQPVETVKLPKDDGRPAKLVDFKNV